MFDIFFNKCEGKIYTLESLEQNIVISIVILNSAIVNFESIFLIFVVKLNWMIYSWTSDIDMLI